MGTLTFVTFVLVPVTASLDIWRKKIGNVLFILFYAANFNINLTAFSHFFTKQQA
jgi:hypothetical protein